MNVREWDPTTGTLGTRTTLDELLSRHYDAQLKRNQIKQIKRIKQSLLGRYKPIKQIDTYHGKFGAMFQGKVSTNLNTLKRGTKITIKNFRDIFRTADYAKHLLKELRILHRFSNHNNIVKIYDIIPPKTFDFTEITVIYEYMNTDLEKIFKTNQSFSTVHVQSIMYQILSGIKCIHSSNMVHLNLRPRNILINASCAIKICDFRLSKNLSEKQDNIQLWGIQNRWYSAPEIVISSEQTNKLYATDMWSIGCIFAELLQMIQSNNNQCIRRPIFVTEIDLDNSRKNEKLFNNRLDQLQRIFDVIGHQQIPLKQKGVCDIYNKYHGTKTYFEQLKFSKKKDSVCKLKQWFLNHDTVQFLSKFLTYDINKRIDSDTALKDNYFEQVTDRYNMKQELILKPVVFESSYDVTTREYIMGEIMKYNENEQEMLLKLGNMDRYMKQRVLLINAYCSKQYESGFIIVDIRYLILKYFCCFIYGCDHKIMSSNNGLKQNKKGIDLREIEEEKCIYKKGDKISFYSNCRKQRVRGKIMKIVKNEKGVKLLKMRYFIGTVRKTEAISTTSTIADIKFITPKYLQNTSTSDLL
eukprot:453597_1